jgi:hypothetical protein
MYKNTFRLSAAEAVIALSYFYFTSSERKARPERERDKCGWLSNLKSKSVYKRDGNEMSGRKEYS